MNNIRATIENKLSILELLLIIRPTVKSLIPGELNPKTEICLVSSCSCIFPIYWSHVFGWKMKMLLEQCRQAMLQLYLSEQYAIAN